MNNTSPEKYKGEEKSLNKLLENADFIKCFYILRSAIICCMKEGFVSKDNISFIAYSFMRLPCFTTLSSCAYIEKRESRLDYCV